MRIINIMFDVYFRLKNYRLCAPLTKILEGPGYPPLTAYPPSHVVTYRFYTGRLSLFNGDYDAAQRDLVRQGFDLFEQRAQLARGIAVVERGDQLDGLSQPLEMSAQLGEEGFVEHGGLRVGERPRTWIPAQAGTQVRTCR